MSSAAPNANQFIAGYQLVDRLGAGGYGEVWRAEGPGGLNKAVKIVFGGFNDARASREMKSLSRIKEVRHPFVLSLERIEIVDGRLIIVSELADMSLKDRLRECRTAGMPGVPRDELLTYMRDAAEGLDHVHDRHSLQHMDIKPENLLLVGGRLKVADFGLVKDMHESQVSGLDGMTPTYAPPELFAGVPDVNSDQYSLAVVYCEVLCNELPFTARTSAEWATLHVSAVRNPVLDHLPPPDRAVVLRALQRNPKERFASCTEFVTALENAGRKPASASGANASAARGAMGDAEDFATERLGSFPIGAAEGGLGTSGLGGMGWDSVAAHQRAISAAASAAPKKSDAPSGGASVSGGPSLFRSTICNQRGRPAVVKLPRMAPVTTPWQPRPTLFLGVGGTAVLVLGGIRRRMLAQFGRGDGTPSFGFLLVDTDPESLRQIGGRESGLGESEAMLMQLRSTREYREASHDLLQWISRRWLYNIPPERKTSGFRPLGRLALVDHGPMFMRRLREELKHLHSAESRGATSRTVGAELTAAPRVVIVASACGGAGSGMVLDMGYAAQQALAELQAAGGEVTGILTVSTPADESARDLALSSACACLNELRFYSLPDHTYSGEPHSGIAPAKKGQPPFQRTYVLHLGQSLSREALAEQCDLTAEYLFHDAATPVGALLEQARRSAPAAISAPPGEPLVHSFRMLPLARCESAVLGDVVPQLRRELIQSLLRPAAAPAENESVPSAAPAEDDPGYYEAQDLLRGIFGQNTNTEFLHLAAMCICRAQKDGRSTVGSLRPVIEEMHNVFEYWSHPADQREASSRTVQRDASEVMRAALRNQLQAVIPDLARSLARRFLDSLSMEKGLKGPAPPAADLLRAATGRLEATTLEVMRNGLRQIDHPRTLLGVLGDPKHAVLRWKEFVSLSAPEPLAAGGARHLLHFSPPSASLNVIDELLNKGLGEPTTLAVWNSPAIVLCQEAQGIPLGPLAEQLVGYKAVYVEAARRLHSRIDVDWPDQASVAP